MSVHRMRNHLRSVLFIFTIRYTHAQAGTHTHTHTHVVISLRLDEMKLIDQWLKNGLIKFEMDFDWMQPIYHHHHHHFNPT